jgi:hypothetical protein
VVNITLRPKDQARISGMSVTSAARRSPTRRAVISVQALIRHQNQRRRRIAPVPVPISTRKRKTAPTLSI